MAKKVNTTPMMTNVLVFIGQNSGSSMGFHFVKLSPS